jgi:hypothetical protein
MDVAVRDRVSMESVRIMLAASDYAPIFFKNRLHLVGRPQMGSRPNRIAGELRRGRSWSSSCSNAASLFAGRAFRYAGARSFVGVVRIRIVRV